MTPLLLVLLAIVPADARIYLAPIKVVEGVDDASRAIIEDALLVAARHRNPNIVGGADLKILLDTEAATQAAGCDSDSCNAELADALGAPELMSAQLAHVGGTWVLSLARLRRDDMHVVARHQVTRPGPAADVLLGAVPELVDVVVGPAHGPPPLLVGGALTGGLGAAVVAGGVVMLGLGAVAFADGKAALDAGDAQKAFEIRRDNEWLTTTGTLVTIAGSAIAIGGVGLVIVSLLQEGGS